MISYWGVEHGEDVSKAFKLPKFGAAKRAVALPKATGPKPPEFDFGDGPKWMGKPVKDQSAVDYHSMKGAQKARRKHGGGTGMTYGTTPPKLF